MAPLAAAKTFVLSTRWAVVSTASAPAPGKVWTTWIVDNRTYLV